MAQNPLTSQIIIDDTGQWQELCAQFAVTPASVINQAVSDDTIFLWMMDHIFAVREFGTNFSALLCNVGGGPI